MAINVHKAPQNQKQTFAQKLNLGVGRGLDQASEMLKEYKKEQELGKQKQAANRLGIDPDLHPDLQKIYAGEKFKNQFSQPKEDKEKAKNEADYSDLQGALGTVDQMRNIRIKGNLGRASSVLGFFGGETAKDRGQYETLGNSLISYASNIPIRNRVEFEKLAGHLSDPSTTDDEADGILEALETIISNSMKKYQPQEESEELENIDGFENSSREIKELDNEAMEKIYKLSKGDKNKAKKIAKKMGYKI